MQSVGGHVANAIVPPGLSTRSISPVATSARGANMCPNWLSTTSNATSSYGNCSASPSRQSTCTSAIAAFSRARESNSGVRSIPQTSAPIRAAVIAATPVPHPTSSTRWPARTPANFTSNAADGVVTASSGAKCAQPCFCASLNLEIASSLMDLPRWDDSIHAKQLRNLFSRRITPR